MWRKQKHRDVRNETYSQRMHRDLLYQNCNRKAVLYLSILNVDLDKHDVGVLLDQRLEDRFHLFGLRDRWRIEKHHSLGREQSRDVGVNTESPTSQQRTEQRDTNQLRLVQLEHMCEIITAGNCSEILRLAGHAGVHWLAEFSRPTDRPVVLASTDLQLCSHSHFGLG